MTSVWEEPLSLREAAFLRLSQQASPAHAESLVSRGSIQEAMRQTSRDPIRRKGVSCLPIWTMARGRGRPFPLGGEATLHPALQDLANILAWEADQAFCAAYYPRLPDTDVPEPHVKRVMAALQREMDGEAHARGRLPVRFEDLPWERQCALAERRRYWYAQFGITPRTWRRGTWSLWRVSQTPLPDEVKSRFH